MKRSTIWMLVAFLFFVVSCGGGGSDTSSSSGPVSTAPGISNLTFTPTSVQVGDGGGAATVTGSVEFIDKEGDLTTLKIRSTDGTVADVELTSDYNGLTSGTIPVIVIVDTSTAGSFPFQVWVVDAAGNSSNELSGTFTVN